MSGEKNRVSEIYTGFLRDGNAILATLEKTDFPYDHATYRHGLDFFASLGGKTIDGSIIEKTRDILEQLETLENAYLDRCARHEAERVAPETRATLQEFADTYIHPGERSSFFSACRDAIDMAISPSKKLRRCYLTADLGEISVLTICLVLVGLFLSSQGLDQLLRYGLLAAGTIGLANLLFRLTRTGSGLVVVLVSLCVLVRGVNVIL